MGEEKKDEWAKHWINRGFRAVEKLLGKHTQFGQNVNKQSKQGKHFCVVLMRFILGSCAGKYCIGDEITLADCCLIPQVFNARRFHVDLRPFPIILRIDRELERHPAFLAAHPSNQPDCPPEAHK